MTGLIDIFKEAIIYPISNIIVLLTIGALLLVSNIPSLLFSYGIDLSPSIVGIFGIIALVVAVLLSGYTLSVIRDAIDMNVSIPKLDFAKNFVDGIKAIVLEIIYYIIPTIIVAIVFFISGAPNSIMKILSFFAENEALLNQTLNSTGAVNTQIFQMIPQEYIVGLINGLAITAIVAIILYLIFGLLYEIALCRLAKYDTLTEGLRFGEVIKDIRTIGIGKYIGWYILLIIITVVLSLVVALITAIPYIGVIISYLLCAPFIFLFASRALGLLYIEADRPE